jgi:hypothetical protein
LDVVFPGMLIILKLTYYHGRKSPRLYLDDDRL